MIHADGFAAGVAILGKHAVETGEAVGSALPHDVALAAQVPVALEAGKVLHVPGPALRLGALVREDDLNRENVGFFLAPNLNLYHEKYF